MNFLASTIDASAIQNFPCTCGHCNCNSDDESESNYSVNDKESSHGNDEDYFEDDEEDEEDDWETDSEYDSELCEREILEALKNDPDLLMRVIELGLAGDQADMNDIIEKLKSLPVNSPVDGVRQRGLADIDPLKVEQAKQGGRGYQEYSDDDDDCEDDSDDDGHKSVKQRH